MTNNVQEVLRRASLFLQEHNREVKIAEILLLHHLKISKAELLMALRDDVAQETLVAFQNDLERHVETGVPVQHLTGREQFYGRDFLVNENVLIPRPETEELVLAVLNRLKTMNRSLKVIDIGTGSGVIAITLKLEHPTLSVQACDLSSDALKVAKKNASLLNAPIEFIESDFLAHWIDQNEKVDCIISNPPYIPWDDRPELEDTVKNFDPQLALFADENGLFAYQQIIKQAESVLSTCGLLAFEIGYQQGEQVRQLIKLSFPNSKVTVCQDINGKDRMVIAELAGSS